MPIEAVAAAGVGGADNVISAYYDRAAAQLGAGMGTEFASGVAGPGEVDAVGSPQAARGAEFGSLVTRSLGALDGMERSTNTKAALAATGQLEDVHDYVLAATSLQTATELTTTVRNKALEAFGEIMRMQL